MRKRNGQALIIVVIIIAIVMAVFANSLTTALRYHAEEETEIYQREQALYVAEIGINQMIFNMNNGATYSDGDQITGNAPSSIGRYTTTYHTGDNFGSGSAYIESKGRVGEVERTVFASVQLGGNSSDAFKYCLFTSTGGRDGVIDDSYFNNLIYGNAYKYNPPGTYAVPYPDPAYYNERNAEKVRDLSGNNTPTYTIKKGDLQKNNVIYIHTDPDATLTIDFIKISDYTFNLSIITDAKNVTIVNLPSNFFGDCTWNGARNSKDENKVYPVITHLGTGTLTLDYSTEWFSTLILHGFVYTGGSIDMKYTYFCWWWGCWRVTDGEINGEIIEQDPQGHLGGAYGDGTHLNYTTDYFTNPPPHFIIPGSETKILPGTFREEY